MEWDREGKNKENYLNDVWISSNKFERKCVSVDLPLIEIFDGEF